MELIPDALFHTDDVKQALIGLMRDLRGIAMATSRLVAWSISIFSEGLDLNVFDTLIFSLFSYSYHSTAEGHMVSYLIGYIQHIFLFFSRP